MKIKKFWPTNLFCKTSTENYSIWFYKEIWEQTFWHILINNTHNKIYYHSLCNFYNEIFKYCWKFCQLHYSHEKTCKLFHNTQVTNLSILHKKKLKFLSWGKTQLSLHIYYIDMEHWSLWIATHTKETYIEVYKCAYYWIN